MFNQLAWDGLPRNRDGARQMRRALFAGLWLFIACVSVHDAYLVALNRHVMEEVELNPVGVHLLHIADGDVWALLAAKATGTVLACSALLLLFWQSRRLGWIVATSVASFQLALLLFLTLT